MEKASCVSTAVTDNTDVWVEKYNNSTKISSQSWWNVLYN